MKNLHLLGLALALSLVGCGDSDNDTESSAKQQSKAKSTMEQSTAAQSTTAVAAKAASGGTLESYDPDVPSMVVEDNGVIQQEEIYKHWPEQTSQISNNSTTIKPATMVKDSSNMPVEEYDPDVPSMVVEDNGVIQQEEIYKHWPEQTAATEESTTMMDKAKEKAQEYVEENKDEMIESAIDSAKDMLK